LLKGEERSYKPTRHFASVFFVAPSKRLLKGVERSYGSKRHGLHYLCRPKFRRDIAYVPLSSASLCWTRLTKQGRRFVTSPGTCCGSTISASHEPHVMTVDLSRCQYVRDVPRVSCTDSLAVRATFEILLP